MKENQRITVTKRMLKEGLLRLLEQKPLDKIRVNELCAESGINRATFYRHYQTPQDVLLELEVDFLKEMAPLSRRPGSNPTPRGSWKAPAPTSTKTGRSPGSCSSATPTRI